MGTPPGSAPAYPPIWEALAAPLYNLDLTIQWSPWNGWIEGGCIRLKFFLVYFNFTLYQKISIIGLQQYFWNKDKLGLMLVRTLLKYVHHWIMFVETTIFPTVFCTFVFHVVWACTQLVFACLCRLIVSYLEVTDQLSVQNSQTLEKTVCSRSILAAF